MCVPPPRDIGGLYSLASDASSMSISRSLLTAFSYFYILRHHELHYTPNISSGSHSVHSLLCLGASLYLPLRYHSSLTSASLLTISPFLRHVPWAATPKLKYAVAPCIYAACLLIGQGVSHFLWRVRATFTCTRNAAFQAFFLYRVLRAEGEYEFELAMREMKIKTVT